jgi:hypothetical protein
VKHSQLSAISITIAMLLNVFHPISACNRERSCSHTLRWSDMGEGCRAAYTGQVQFTPILSILVPLLSLLLLMLFLLLSLLSLLSPLLSLLLLLPILSLHLLLLSIIFPWECSFYSGIRIKLFWLMKTLKYFNPEFISAVVILVEAVKLHENVTHHYF